MLNTRRAQWRTYHSKIWAIRGPPQKVTGYRYEEETACEQRARDFKRTWTPPHPLLPPLTLVPQLFFVSSSFLIAANRDVKTIRALSVDSVPMLIFFLCSPFLSLPPFLVYDIHMYILKICVSLKYSFLDIYIFLRVLEIDQGTRYFKGAQSGKRGVDFLAKWIIEAICLLAQCYAVIYARKEMKNAKLFEEEAARRIVASALSRKFHPPRVSSLRYRRCKRHLPGSKRGNEKREARSQVARDLQYF